MPEISRFYGIAIKMFHNDHQPPHFHAEQGKRRAYDRLRRKTAVNGRAYSVLSSRRDPTVNPRWMRRLAC